MEEPMASRYWCYHCEQIVNPIMEQQVEEIKCPFCQSGFVEEMAATDSVSSGSPMPDFARNNTDRALSLWAPILLGMMGHPRRRRRFRHLDFDFDDDNEDNDNNDNDSDADADADAGNEDLRGGDRELISIIRRRRRSSAAILQLLHGIRAGLASESHNLDTFTERDMERDERERVILINPFNQTLLAEGQNENQNPIGSLGDYFIGPGLDLLLQHLAENDPNRYGTPPARKEAVEAMPTVAIKDSLQCPVCLDDFEVGAEAKEMPCGHKFHSACILPWLELHSSCPVCRFQLPADESKHNSDGLSNGNVQRAIGSENNSSRANGGEEEGDGEGRNGSGGRRFSIPWPFSGLFSSSNGGNSTSSSQANANATGTSGSGSASSSSRTNEN